MHACVQVLVYAPGFYSSAVALRPSLGGTGALGRRGGANSLDAAAGATVEDSGGSGAGGEAGSGDAAGAALHVSFACSRSFAPGDAVRVILPGDSARWCVRTAGAWTRRTTDTCMGRGYLCQGSRSAVLARQRGARAGAKGPEEARGQKWRMRFRQRSGGRRRRRRR